MDKTKTVYPPASISERIKTLENALVDVIVRLSGRDGWGEDGLKRACDDVVGTCQKAIEKY